MAAYVTAAMPPVGSESIETIALSAYLINEIECGYLQFGFIYTKIKCV